MRLSLLGLLAMTAEAGDRFHPAQILAGQVEDLSAVHAVDLSGDGIPDLLSASSGDGKIAWYENTDGLGTFGSQRIITEDAEGAQAVFAADLDGDLDQDVLSASFSDKTIAWYENTDGLGTFGPRQVIGVLQSAATAVFAADLDGDGDQDVLSGEWSHAKVSWFENLDGLGSFGAPQVITDAAWDVRSLFAADLDGDLDLDVLSASREDDKIAWYENTDGLGTFGAQQVISVLADGASSVFAGDLDGDGDPDVVSSSSLDDTVAWYENTDGLGAFGVEQVIASSAGGAESLLLVNLDGDLDLDVLCASFDDGTVAWYENADGAGTFAPAQTIALLVDGVVAVLAADLNDDGDPDVVSAASGEDTIAWYENLDGAGSFGPARPVIAGAEGARSVFAADLDGDGDDDVISGSYFDHKVAWYENLDGLGTFGPQRVISTLNDRTSNVFAADLDGDLDLDVLSASLFDDKIAWYENLDGLGTFGPQQVITLLADGAEGVRAADIDGDLDLDVIAISYLDDEVAWYENTDGLGTFGPQRIISNQADYATSVAAIDLDGDGDQDVLSTSSGDMKVAWYENLDGLGTFGPQLLIANDADGARSVFAVDLDGDLDPDVVAASYNDDKISWWENLDGAGTFGPRQVITDTADGSVFVFVGDLDGDGDPDVLSASSSDNTVSWFENLDGLGTFGARATITEDAEAAAAVFATDLDGDLDLDVLVASYYDGRVAWFENDVRAAAVFRNGGANPASYTAGSLPVLGSTYQALVDLAGTTGHTHAILVGYAAPLSIPVGVPGTVLVNPTSRELLGFPLGLGPIATIDVAIPLDPALAGMEVFTQTAHIGGITPYILSNAQDLFLGF
jgi:hypothetical protein